MKLIQLFQSIFSDAKKDDLQCFFAPGRINIIGEHVDYNGGHVLPAAISLGTYAVARKRNDKVIQLYSANMKDSGIIQLNVNDTSYRPDDDWANYPKGVIHMLKKAGYTFTHGFDVLYVGNLPNGAGLSSSASIEMVTGVMLKDLFSLHISTLDLIKIGKQVENEYIGINSGIMDQFAIGMGKKDHCILLNTESLSYKYAPITLNDYVFLIINTNKQRTLTDSKYNERRAECDEALVFLKQHYPINQLCDLSVAQLDEVLKMLPNESLRKRVSHVVTENARTESAYHHLHKGNFKQLGLLLTASHESLRQNFEVTGIELDTIVHIANKLNGVLGSRMTGAGFGGCAIALVTKNKVKEITNEMIKQYTKKIGYAPSVYTATISEGATKISNHFQTNY